MKNGKYFLGAVMALCSTGLSAYTGNAEYFSDAFITPYSPVNSGLPLSQRLMILSFKQCFVPAMMAGTKPHTIRAGRRWRAGMSIQFYQDARQKTMLKFRPDAVATVVQEIEIGRRLTGDRQIAIVVDGRFLTPLECQELSQRDGFDDFAGLLKFIDEAHGLFFRGQLIHWTDLRY